MSVTAKRYAKWLANIFGKLIGIDINEIIRHIKRIGGIHG
jgi:hypothetical protein